MKIFILTLFFYSLLFASDEVFDSSANLYIKGKLQEAARLIQTALQADPTDEKLRALLDKIREELEQEKQDSQGGNSEEQEQDEQQQDQDQQQGEDQQEKEEQNKQAGQEQQGEENKEQEEQRQAEQTQARERDEINKEEAERILKALQADEQDAQKKKPPVRGSRRARGKDW